MAMSDHWNEIPCQTKDGQYERCYGLDLGKKICLLSWDKKNSINKKLKKKKTEVEVGGHKPRKAGTCKKLQEAKEDLPLELSEEIEPHWHLDFGLLVPKTVTKFISIVLSHQVCDHLFQHSWEINTIGLRKTFLCIQDANITKYKHFLQSELLFA